MTIIDILDSVESIPETPENFRERRTAIKGLKELAKQEASK